MNLYLISQTAKDGYDVYDSVVVAAKNGGEAARITPNGSAFGEDYGTWCESPDEVTVRLIGKAAKGTAAGVILASFNAG